MSSSRNPLAYTLAPLNNVTYMYVYMCVCIYIFVRSNNNQHCFVAALFLSIRGNHIHNFQIYTKLIRKWFFHVSLLSHISFFFPPQVFNDFRVAFSLFLRSLVHSHRLLIHVFVRRQMKQQFIFGPPNHVAEWIPLSANPNRAFQMWCRFGEQKLARHQQQQQQHTHTHTTTKIVNRQKRPQTINLNGACFFVCVARSLEKGQIASIV